MTISYKRVLRIDIETYSSVDLIKCGVYKYVDADDFEILLFGYAFDEDPVQVIDLTTQALPGQLLTALTDPKIIKTAYNANFERTCLAKHFKLLMDPKQWRCTAVHASYLGLPNGLGGVASVLGLDAQKDAKGKNLIKYFSMPCKPTKINGGRTRNLPAHALEKWQRYIDYCRQDVEVERQMAKKLSRYPLPDQEQLLWVLDQQINDRGVKVDQTLVTHAMECDELSKEKFINDLKNLTGLANPNSGPQLKNWMEQEGYEVDSLAKEAVDVLLKEVESKKVKQVLKLKQLTSKTSVKKYAAMERMVCSDGHIRGMLQFYGANRTGRWAGRGVQIHNLKRNYLKDLDLARDILRSGDYELLDLLFGNVPDVLSQLIRTAFIPEKGERFCVSDFSAIEARVLAWLANEKWVLDVFNTHGKLYEATASRMFNVPLELIKKGNPEYELRAKGKVATLALGYQGSVPAMIDMGALRDGLKEEELQGLVDVWRSANPNIKKYWYAVGKAAIKAVKCKKPVKLDSNITFIPTSSFLFIKLPSGRRLAYFKPKLYQGKFGEALCYEGVDSNKRWSRVDTYGGKLVENIVQAIARDCLAVSMQRLDQAGYQIRIHVHDEVVISHDEDKDCLKEITEIMGQPIEWAPGLPLKAEAFYTSFYMKD